MKRAEDLPLPQRILFAAFETFVERGYEKTSMDEVASAAATTKRTVYAHFGSKEALFREAIAKAVQRFLSELPVLDTHGDPENELFGFALQFSELSTWRKAVLLQRVVIGEAERLPDLGGLLHQDVIVAAERRIARFLSYRFAPIGSALQDGELDDEWAMAPARLFLNMATAPQRIATLMQARVPAPVHPFVEASGVDATWVRDAVRFFLDGLARRTVPRRDT